MDLGDATLLPGFIDAYMHLTFEAGDNYVADFFEDLRRTVPEKALLSGESAAEKVFFVMKGGKTRRPPSRQRTARSAPGR